MPLKEFIKYLDLKKLERLRVRMIIEKGEITELVYQYESFLNNKWQSIVRYDTAHVFFHRDVLYPDGSQEKYSIEIDTLKTASLYA
jgi:hypothetical protein